jgi:hypothetical protein
MDFTSFSQTLVLFKKLTFTEVPGNLDHLTNMPYVHT